MIHCHCLKQICLTAVCQPYNRKIESYKAKVPFWNSEIRVGRVCSGHLGSVLETMLKMLLPLAWLQAKVPNSISTSYASLGLAAIRSDHSWLRMVGSILNHIDSEANSHLKKKKIRKPVELTLFQFMAWSIRHDFFSFNGHLVARKSYSRPPKNEAQTSSATPRKY